MENQVDERPIVEITVRSDYEDYRRYYFFIQRRRPVWWAMLTIFYGIAPAWLFFSFFRELQQGIIQLGLLPAFAMMTIGMAYMIILPRWFYRKNYETYNADIGYSFYEDHIFVQVSEKSSQTEIEANYDRYVWVTETKSAFYQKKLNNDFVNLPKKCITDEQQQTLRELYARKFGDQFIVKT